MNRQPAGPGNQLGDRIVLVRTSDLHTRLVPGTAGTVTGYDTRLGQLAVAWDDGSTEMARGQPGPRFASKTPGRLARSCPSAPKGRRQAHGGPVWHAGPSQRRQSGC